MAWSATMIGALLGVGTQMYSNALRKLPYMRRMIDLLLFSFISLFSNPNFNSKAASLYNSVIFDCRSLGARAWDGTWGCICETARQMGCPTPGRPR